MHNVYNMQVNATVPLLQGHLFYNEKMALYKRGVLSWANDNLVEFCYLIVHEIWSDKRAEVER
jgi:hypothetical protein